MKQEDKNPKKESSKGLTHIIRDVGGSAFKWATKSAGASLSRTLIPTQERIKMMQDAGAYVKDVRELTGMTINDLSDAMDLKDQSLIAAVENGTATLSFELILRLASLLARHDPLPFVMKLARTYNPELWSLLEDWGIGRLPLHFERERKFINIYRSQDQVRKLSDEGFDKVLKLTQSAFDMALHFVAEVEGKREPEEDYFSKQKPTVTTAAKASASKSSATKSSSAKMPLGDDDFNDNPAEFRK